MHSHEESVHTQFDPRAQAYLGSAVHARGADLECARAWVAAHLEGRGEALDVGCGAGHLSFALAPQVAQVIALDPSPNMLATVAATAAERGLANVATCSGTAEALPFENERFALVATRYSAHHWARLEAALAEMHRVLAPGGRVLIIDVLGADSALVDTHLQAMELLRDPSHVRDRAAYEWRALLAAQGFIDLSSASWPLRLDFAAWIERMQTPASSAAMIRSMQQRAPREVRDALAFEADGSFTCTTGAFWGRRGE